MQLKHKKQKPVSAFTQPSRALIEARRQSVSGHDNFTEAELGKLSNLRCVQKGLIADMEADREFHIIISNATRT